MNRRFWLLWMCIMSGTIVPLSYAASTSIAANARPARTAAQELVDAAASGDMATVKRLLDADTPVASAMPLTAAQALHHAAANGHLSLVDLLLKRGAPVNGEDADGATPLIYAAYAGRVEVVKRLLAAGAAVNHVPNRQVHALNAAMMSGSLDTVVALLHAGADPKLPDQFGKNALQYAAQIHRTDLQAVLAVDNKATP
ncbi:hypothetical protein C7S18_02630 [Ahniella affigens]|uniref:Uncharacterized protein n=1 Tax=Ahniella affigens TaxID=2021234 RepID=A0A2P1PMU2_9GAMM|nr:ankyrin repeat domain-containing protein [Ahniella affigens]AVP96155.1 hypothetical protein C7S18_02630 [Ahniella affigens]